MRTIGNSRRLVLMASRARVMAFSSSRRARRAASHSSWVAIFGRVMHVRPPPPAELISGEQRPQQQGDAGDRRGADEHVVGAAPDLSSLRIEAHAVSMVPRVEAIE